MAIFIKISKEEGREMIIKDEISNVGVVRSICRIQLSILTSSKSMLELLLGEPLPLSICQAEVVGGLEKRMQTSATTKS